jgi:galactokinase
MANLSPGDPRELVASTATAFRTAYGTEAGVVGHAPGRVNLIGEHTDYNDGLCLPVALPHRTYAAAAPRSDGQVRIASRQATEAWERALDDVAPGAVTGWAAYAAGVLWALRETGLSVDGVDLMIDSTVPLGAGLSSSAALEAAVAMAATALLGEPATEALRRTLVEVCRRAETEIAGAPTGGMDQTVSLLAEQGAALLIDFGGGGTRSVPLGQGAPEVLVMDTGVSHALTDGAYASRRRECEEAAGLLGLPSLRAASDADLDRLEAGGVLHRRARHVVGEIARVVDAVAAIEAADWDEVGRLFLASHASLRDDFEVSCPELDVAVEAAVEAGARGARMTGGGFGGSAIALVEPGEVDRVGATVAAAFTAKGWEPPTTLLAPASGPASWDRLA